MGRIYLSYQTLLQLALDKRGSSCMKRGGGTCKSPDEAKENAKGDVVEPYWTKTKYIHR